VAAPQQLFSLVRGVDRSVQHSDGMMVAPMARIEVPML
jgi:hypothetical protein